MAGLIDLHLEGYSYTWTRKSASKMSKVDKFLISEEDKQHSNASKSSIQSRLSDLDKMIDQGKGNEGLVNERSMLLTELQDLNASASLDMAQKEKILWTIEGEENSKYVHGIINKKRYWNLIDQDVVDAVFEFFLSSKFPPGCNSSFITLIPKTQVAKAIYGDRGALDNPCILSRRSPWIDIIREFDTLSRKGVDLHSHVKRKWVMMSIPLFGFWLTEAPLKHIYSRLFALECDKHASIACKFRDSSLIASFRRAPRGGIEEEQHYLLADRAATVILSSINDKWV
nr:hypothetical protein [Tanacetum cinerariifolium]